MLKRDLIKSLFFIDELEFTAIIYLYITYLKHEVFILSRRYHDSFFKLCSALLETHEAISIRSLAPFLEVARTTLREGIKRVDAVDMEITSESEELIADLVTWYFDNTENTISSYMSDEEMTELYHFGDEILVNSSSSQSNPATKPKPVSKPKQEELEFEVDDEKLVEKFDKKIRTENQKRDDESLADYVFRLAKQKQRLQDVTNVERAMFRNTVRACNAVEELNTELLDLLNERRDVLTQTTPVKTKVVDGENTKVGVIQVSDLHLGELVKETLDNRYDLDIASKRIKKFIERTKVLFKADNITNVAVMMTGDMINSTRRISEITTYADARTKVVFNAYLILGAMLEDLRTEFNVTVSHVVGNESRLSEYFDTTNYLVSDNFDLLLYQMLKHTHERDGMTFIFDHSNPMEQVIDINGVNFLLVHGNGHSGLARTNKIESEVQKLKARYAYNNVIIHYVICGHIHSTYIGNNFARSASTVGSNAYAERDLNFTSKASQNLFVVDKDGSIDGYMIDLQKCDGYEGYHFDRESKIGRAHV